MTETKISAGTIARTVCFALALINQILSATGHAVLPIEDEQIESLVTVGLTVATGIISWWKNNSFTKEAREADGILRSLKAQRK